MSVFSFLGAGLALATALAAARAVDEPAVSTAAVTAPSAPAQPTEAPPPPPVQTPAGKAEAVGAETCLSCHQAQANFTHSSHAGAFAKVRGIPFAQSCETCHGPGSLHAEAAGDRSNPGFGTIKGFKQLAAGQVNASCMECHEGGLQIHWTGGAHAGRGLSCISCHSIHGAKSGQNLLAEATVDQNCAKCHQSIAAKVRRNGHMPVAEGKMSCANCHNPHGSATDKMIRQASVNQNCYECHADKRGPFLWEHAPVRENCLTCHNPHGSHHENMLVAKQPFLCQRCHIATRHPAQLYDRTQLAGQSNRLLAQSCMNCHSNVHGSNHPSGKFFLR